MIEALREICAADEVDVVVLARGGGSFDDLLPFSDEKLLRALAAAPVPVVSAVGHEQDTPLCDLAADARASTPTAAARLVVPDATELIARLQRSRSGLARGARTVVELRRQSLTQAHDRLQRAPALAVERKRARLELAAGRLRALSPRATLVRGYSIVRSGDEIVRSAEDVSPGDAVEVEGADGRFGARVE
jgi:exodeoxyribonuclease VII large subunit